ncbi:hypothetical protein DB346_23445 [Verrucomicrobia bacterium LW23]|nr:hypothetical protein DB346_23445 [Verrucomicrobia bacterium LW23]
MELVDAIRTLAEELNLPDGIDADEDGVYTVVFDGELAVEILPWTGGDFLLRSPLAAIPSGDADKEKTMVQRVLQFSLARLRGRRSSIALDTVSNRFIISRILPHSEMRPYEFTAAVEDFISDLEMWQTFLESGAATSASGGTYNSSPSSGGTMPMMIIMP